MPANPSFEEGQKLQWQGRYAEALRYYEQALKAEPNSGTIYHQMAICWTHMGFGDQARACLEKAAQLDPEIAKSLERERARREPMKLLYELEKQDLLNDLQPVLELVASEDLKVRYGAQDLLRKARLMVSAFDQLIEGLSSENPIVREAVANALYARAPLAPAERDKVVPALVTALKDAHDPIREKASLALLKIADKRAVAGLIEALKDVQDRTRFNAAKALAAIGDPSAIPALEELARSDPSALAREGAEQAIKKLSAG